MRKLARKQKGITQVEFSILALILMLIIFAILEFAAYFYSIQMVNEITRRAARLATVCYIADRDDIPQLDSLTALYPAGFDADNLEISYLDSAGGNVDVGGFLSTPPAGQAVLDAQFDQIRYVRARSVNYTYNFIVLSGLVNVVGNTPAFETILPAESLGVLRSDTDDKTDC